VFAEPSQVLQWKFSNTFLSNSKFALSILLKISFKNGRKSFFQQFSCVFFFKKNTAVKLINACTTRGVSRERFHFSSFRIFGWRCKFWQRWDSNRSDFQRNGEFLKQNRVECYRRMKRKIQAEKWKKSPKNSFVEKSCFVFHRTTTTRSTHTHTHTHSTLHPHLHFRSWIFPPGTWRGNVSKIKTGLCVF